MGLDLGQDWGNRARGNGGGWHYGWENLWLGKLQEIGVKRGIRSIEHRTFFVVQLYHVLEYPAILSAGQRF